MNKKTVIIIVALVLVIGLGAGAYFLFLAKPKEEKYVEYYYAPGDAFITNVSGSSTLIKVALSLAVSYDAAEDLTPMNAVIRDNIYDVLRNASADDVKSADAQTILSNAICKKLNDAFAIYGNEKFTNMFLRVYFTEIVMQ